MAWFSTFAIVFMLFVMYNYEDELRVFEDVFHQRFFQPDSHGQSTISYVSKFSFTTNSLLFLINFMIFMFYFQLSLLGIFSTFDVMFPLLLEFLILFFYVNKHINLHLRVLSMDTYQYMTDQQGFQTCHGLKLYFVAFVLIIFLQKCYFTPFYSLLLFCCLWIPQIVKTTW